MSTIKLLLGATMLLFAFDAMPLYAAINQQSQPVSLEKKAAKGNKEDFYNEDKLNIAVTADQPAFTIKLKSNPTTGYRWYLREYNQALIMPVTHRFLAADKNNNLMGAPGYELWTFKVKPEAFTVPQQMTLRMVYARPWQGADNSSQLVFRISTHAKE